MGLRHPVYVYRDNAQGPIGCLKLQVIYRKRATNYRALLRTIFENVSSTQYCNCEGYEGGRKVTLNWICDAVRKIPLCMEMRPA